MKAFKESSYRLRISKGLSLLLVCTCTIGQAATGSREAAPGAASVSGIAKKLAKTHTVTPIITDKEQVTQDFLDDLKVGKPRLLVISLLDSDVQQQAAALRKQRNLRFDDAVVIEMERKADGELKTAFLSNYSNTELQVVTDFASTAQLLVHISSLQVLQRLLDDPRVSLISSPIPIYPASSGTSRAGNAANLQALRPIRGTSRTSAGIQRWSAVRIIPLPRTIKQLHQPMSVPI